MIKLIYFHKIHRKNLNIRSDLLFVSVGLKQHHSGANLLSFSNVCHLIQCYNICGPFWSVIQTKQNIYERFQT